MKSIKSFEKGQALVVIALAAVALFGFVALAIDGTAKFADRRNAQNAADTASLAAALAKVNSLTDGDSNTPLACTSEDMSTASEVCVELVLAGLNRADSNGYDTANSTVAIYSPPLNGYYATVSNSDDYVQVIITSHVPTTFMRIFGVTQSDNIVSAVAYMKEGRELADGAMIISYDPDPSCPSGPGNGGGSVDVSGSSTLNLNDGGIFINSGTACGYNAPNCPEINIGGGAGINSVAAVDNIDQKDGFCTYPPPWVQPPEILNQEPIAIPDDIYWPDVPPECGIPAAADPLGPDPSDGEPAWLIHPGYYGDDFPQATIVPNNKHIYMASGIYCIDPRADQDLSWNSQSFLSLNGSTNPSKNHFHAYNPDGVTLYIKSGGGFKFNVNSPIYLDASTAGDLQGYLIVLEGTHTSIEGCEIEGGAYLDINGLIFAPYCDITVNGQSAPNADINAQLIGWDIKITGNAVINFNYDPDNQVHLKRKLGLMK